MQSKESQPSIIKCSYFDSELVFQVSKKCPKTAKSWGNTKFSRRSAVEQELFSKSIYEKLLFRIRISVLDALKKSECMSHNIAHKHKPAPVISYIFAQKSLKMVNCWLYQTFECEFEFRTSKYLYFEELRGGRKISSPPPE